MKIILSENQYQNLVKFFINESSNSEDPLTTYLKDVPELIPIYKEIETILKDKFTSEHFEQEINYSEGLKKVSNSLNSSAVDAFEKMKKKYKLSSKIKQNSLRDYNLQKNMFLIMAKKHGNTISGGLRQAALPGFSQHHTGKAFDVSNYLKITEKMLEEFGFYRPYPKDTGFRMSEPWHIYYAK